MKPHRKIRSVCNLAATQLEYLGYTILKTAAGTPTFDLIAVSEDETLFITTRRLRNIQATSPRVADTYHDIISDMQNTTVPKNAEKQFWIYQNVLEGFAIYKVFENGIMKKELHSQS